MPNQLTFMKNGQAVTTDLIVAKVFNKTPTAVRRAITNLKCNEKFRASNFLQSPYRDPCGKRCSSYLITKDGFFLLSIRMNGKKTEALKIQYMDAFNQLDRNLNISIHMFNELCRYVETRKSDIQQAACREMSNKHVQFTLEKCLNNVQENLQLDLFGDIES